jgi:acyl carrier protein
MTAPEETNMLTPTLTSEVLSVLRDFVSQDTPLDDSSGTTSLLDLGVDSIQLVSIIIELERRIGLDFNKVVGLEPPRTVDDLLNLAAQGLQE